MNVLQTAISLFPVPAFQLVEKLKVEAIVVCKQIKHIYGGDFSAGITKGLNLGLV